MEKISHLESYSLSEIIGDFVREEDLESLDLTDRHIRNELIMLVDRLEPEHEFLVNLLLKTGDHQIWKAMIMSNATNVVAFEEYLAYIIENFDYNEELGDLEFFNKLSFKLSNYVPINSLKLDKVLEMAPSLIDVRSSAFYMCNNSHIFAATSFHSLEAFAKFLINFAKCNHGENAEILSETVYAYIQQELIDKGHELKENGSYMSDEDEGKLTPVFKKILPMYKGLNYKYVIQLGSGELANKAKAYNLLDFDDEDEEDGSPSVEGIELADDEQKLELLDQYVPFDFGFHGANERISNNVLYEFSKVKHSDKLSKEIANRLIEFGLQRLLYDDTLVNFVQNSKDPFVRQILSSPNLRSFEFEQSYLKVRDIHQYTPEVLEEFITGKIGQNSDIRDEVLFQTYQLGDSSLNTLILINNPDFKYRDEIIESGKYNR